MGLINKLVAMIAPHECIVCGVQGSILCTSCQSVEIFEVPSRCYRCKKLTKEFRVCVSCKSSSSLNHVWVSTLYDPIPKKLIRKLKFEYAIDAARDMAQIMDNLTPVTDSFEVIHIPTASSRVRSRGFDHSKEITKNFCKIRSQIPQSYLIRIGQTRQVRSSPQMRKKQMQDAFLCPHDMTGKSILLIDDVLTTGSTLESAAKVLRKAGVKTVSALVFAQKM